MKHHILVYRTNPNLIDIDRADEEMTMVSSPFTAVHEVMQKRYDLIVVIFDCASLQERASLIGFCYGFRNEYHNGGSSLLCVLQYKHRKLLEHLRDVGVKYVMIVRPEEFHGKSLKKRLEAFSSMRLQEFHIDRMLSEVCPFINYFPLDSQREILYCGAYQNQLVLGGSLLKNYCETSNFSICNYFNNPKPRK